MPEGSHIDVTLKQTKDSAKNWKQDRHSRVSKFLATQKLK
jgi:hypothetical protein